MSKIRLTTAKIAVLVIIATLCSSLLGFVREMILANYFGAGMISDSYVMGISIPTTLLAAVFTAIGTAYMPVLADSFEHGGIPRANEVTSRLMNLMIIIVGAVYIICLIFSGTLVGIFAPGYEGEKQDLTVYYMRIAFITLFFMAGTTFFDAYLKYRGTFATQKFIAIVQNVFTIIFIILAARSDHHLMIFGLVIGYGVSCIGQLLLARRKGFRYSAEFGFKGPVQEVIRLALPVFIGGGFSELNTFIDKMLASTLSEGSVTALNYSGKMITLILTFTAGTVSTIIYPKLNQAFAQGNNERINDLTERGINLLAVMTVPFTLGAMFCATPLVKIIFERGAFSGTATKLVATAVFFYALRIPFYAVSQLLNNAFYAMHDTKLSVYCSVAAVFVNIGLNFALVRILGLAGLAIATSAAEAVGMITRGIVFAKKYKDIKILRSRRKLLRTVIFSIVAVGLSYVVYLLTGGLQSLIIRLAVSIITAVVLYMIMLFAARFDELKLIRDLI